MKHTFYTIIGLLLGLGLLAGCSLGYDPMRNMPQDGIVFTISVGDHLRASPEEGEDAFNENKIESVWFFAAKQGQNDLFIASQCEKLSAGSYRVAVTKQQNTQLDGGMLRIYVVANLPFAEGNKPTTVDALQSHLVQTPTLNQQLQPSFVMWGGLDKAVNSAQEQAQDLGRVDLKRILAKVRISEPTLELDGYTLVGAPKVKFTNYRNAGQLMNEVNAGALVQPGSDQFSPMNESFQGKKVKRLYSYYAEWANASPETAGLILALQLKKDGTPDDQARTYFYHVPIKSPSNSLKSNTLYDISVSIRTLGGPEEGEPTEVYSNEVKVMPWVLDPEVDSDLASPKYLLVEEENVIMSVVETYSVAYKSSSDINAVITECYYKYVNEYGVEVKDNIAPGDEYYPSIEVDAHAVTFKAKVQRNNVPKYFTVKLSNQEGLSGEIRVEQYPAEYIIYTMGTKSSWRPDGSLPPNLNNKAMYHIVTLIPPKDGTMVLGFPKTTVVDFYKKDTNEIKFTDSHVTADDEETANTVSPSFELASQLGATVRMPYRELDGNGHYVYHKNPQDDYAVHVCASYIEYREVGGVEVKLDDWRLPTRAEIELVDRLQHDPKSAVRAIMTGKYYWSGLSASAIKMRNGEGSATNSSAHTRCVRDVKKHDL